MKAYFKNFIGLFITYFLWMGCFISIGGTIRQGMSSGWTFDLILRQLITLGILLPLIYLIYVVWMKQRTISVLMMVVAVTGLLLGLFNA